MADIPRQQQQYPNLNPYSSTDGSGNSAQDVRSTVVNSKYHTIPLPKPARHPQVLTTTMADAQSTKDSVQNSQTVQSIRNGPVADKARLEADQTKSEFNNLASSRQTPTAQASTGQNLTHYHSFFYNLLSWENPRATAISYASIVVFIFAARYLPIVRYALRLTWMVLGITAAAEVAGKALFDQGFATKLRPKTYYTIPRETLESLLEDATELINFFVIEFQRIVFAENVYATIGAFFAAVLTYFLIKITPPWGLALMFTTVIYFVPLVYIRNQELIDHHVNNAGNILQAQTQQVRDLASQHTSKAVEMSSNALKDYSAKAQGMMGTAKKQAVEKGVVSSDTADNVVGRPEQGMSMGVKSDDFPSAPKAEPATANLSAAPQSEPVAQPAQ